MEVAAQPKADPKKIGIALGIMAILENMYKTQAYLIFTPLEQLWLVPTTIAGFDMIIVRVARKKLIYEDSASL